MANVKISQFGGIAPRLHPTQLADGMAVTAHNCRLKNGKLQPLRQPASYQGAPTLLEEGLKTISLANSMHIWRKQDGTFDFLMFKGVTWSAPGNVADDDLTRIIISGDRNGDGKTDNPVVYMRNTSNQKEYVSICKSALKAPHVKRNEEGNPELTGNIRYTRFFITWVDKYGMESPFSPPSLVKKTDISNEWIEGELEYLDGDTITVSDFGTWADKPPSAVLLRVYKVITGSESAQSQFITEVRADVQSPWDLGISFKVKDEDAGEIMPDIESAPLDLTQITEVPGAFYCGVAESDPKTVCFSDINMFYSWPVAYRYDIKDNIVALAVTSNSVFALTDGFPYVLSGTAPESMTVAKLANPAACVSARGVCVCNNAVYYVSNIGLMVISNSATEGTICRNLTDKMFTKDQWQTYNPSSCLIGQHDNSVFMFFTLANGSKKGLVIDLTEGAQTAVSTHDEIASCVCVDYKTDEMFYVREGQ